MNTIQLYSFPFNDLDEDISIGNQAFYGSGIQGDVVLKTKSSVGVNAFASCKRLNSLLFTHTMNTGPYVNISTTKNIYGNMSSSFRCYVPLNIFYAKAPYVYNSSTNATDAEQLMPYLTADADSKYQIVCFPTVKNYSGKDVYSLNIDLGPYFKAGGKLYRVGCKTQNPVNASGIYGYFPIITTDAVLKKIDGMLCEAIRIISTGKRGGGKYRVSYQTIREWDFRSLVSRWYRHLKRGK